jgi:hypothetical protein
MKSPVYKTTPHEWGLNRPSRIDPAPFCSPEIHFGAGRAGVSRPHGKTYP